MHSPAYWGVVSIPFLKLGQFTIEKRNEAIRWCKENCENMYATSDIRPWAFLSKRDAELFQEKFGGEVKYKPEENL